jgi:hypothetical protein
MIDYDDLAIQLYRTAQYGYRRSKLSIPHSPDLRMVSVYDISRGETITKGRVMSYTGVSRFRLSKMLVNDIVVWWIYDHLQNIAKLRFLTNHRITVQHRGDGTAFLVNTSDEALVEARLLGLF